MPDLLRVITVWSGFPGAPGYSNFYFEAPAITTPAATAAVAKVRQMFAEVSLWMPSGVSLTFDPVVAQIDEGSGAQSDEINTGAAPSPVTGSSPAERSAPSGCAINWRTGTFVGGRRLRGRTFIVPLSIAAYEADGTLKPGAVGDIRTAAQTLATAGLTDPAHLVVWHRPVAGVGGSSGRVTTASVTDRAAILTSRR